MVLGMHLWRNVSVRRVRAPCRFLLLLLLLSLHQPGAKTEDVTVIPDEGEFYSRFQQEHLIVQETICNEKCGERVHTACKTIEIPICDKYEIYQIFRVEYMKRTDLKHLLLSGHNGLRHRIAQKMGVANMVKVTWDDYLADMTVAYFMQCGGFVDDPCTQNVFSEKTDTLDYHEKDLYKWIAQNRFNVESEFFPNNFIESALGTWYFEKDNLFAPKYHYDDTIQANVGIVKEENNFTHLANPLMFRVGCSMARIDNSFSLVCNYYPFYRSQSKQIAFIKGDPSTICPNYFPLPDHYFSGLCTDGIFISGAQLIARGQLCLFAWVWVVVTMWRLICTN